MNIAVITPFDSPNYGAYLQAYCLKKILEQMGYSVVHPFTRDKEYIRDLYFRLSRRYWLIPWKIPKKTSFAQRKFEIFTEAQKEFVTVEMDNADADLYILGSDEIWNLNKEVFCKPIFWGQGLYPVVSYAPSLGSASAEVLAKYPDKINALRDMAAVLVRDKRTAQAVQSCAQVPAELVCDPTLLLPVSAYGEAFADPYLREHDCMLVYAYATINPKQRKAIQKSARKLNLKTVACCFQHDWCDHQCECSPLQFSSLIRQCKAVTTTTFHGTLFSILNHVNFVSIPMSPKTTQILAQLQLEDRAVSKDIVSADRIAEVLLHDNMDYEQVEVQIGDIRKNSMALFNAAIQKAVRKKERTFSHEICSADRCTGCFACMNKCPKEAITTVVDVYGCTLPMIDPEKCMKCGLCKAVCLERHRPALKEPLHCYAAQRKDAQARKQSASGGIGAALMEQIIRNGGVVYGAAVCENGEVRHIRAADLDTAARMRKSKYVQSYIGVAYQQALADLKENRQVLFTGTPCQIAGLKGFLGKSYDSLYCVDIICHGVPPMQYLREHIVAVMGEKPVEELTFRGGDQDFRLNVTSAGTKVYSKDKNRDAYFYAFMKSATYRENCYACHYARSARISDITIGDFWGLRSGTLVTQQTGNISVVLINTLKGKSLLESIRPELVLEERTLQEAVKGNPQLRRPTIKHKRRNAFLRAYVRTGNFEQAVTFCGLAKEGKIAAVMSSLNKIKRSFIGRRNHK